MSRKLTVRGMELLNSNGEVDASSMGFLFLLDSMAFLIKKVIEQKFFEFSIAEYVPVDVGTGGWASEIVQPKEFLTGGSFYEGDINDQAGRGRMAETNAATSPIRIPTRNWAKKVSWNIFELAEAANSATGWDIQSSLLKSLKKNWDLGIQEQAMLGHPVRNDIPGLLNAPEVTINTLVLAAPISQMSQTQMDALVGALLKAYYQNSGSTVFPDRLVIPTSDYLGLASILPGSVGQITRLEYLLNAFKKMTRDESFEILPLNYAEKDQLKTRGMNVSRYMLYRNEPEVMSFYIPVDFHMLPGKVSDDNISFVSTAYGQYSGVMVKRPGELMYFDIAA